MKAFNYKRRNFTSGPYLLGFLLILAGIFSFISPLFLKSDYSLERVLGTGAATLCIGVLIVSSYEGILLDLHQKKFKEYIQVVGFKFGQWKNLPAISKIKVVSKSFYSKNTANGISPTLSGKVTEFKMLLYTNSAKAEFIFNYSKKDKALIQARNLSEQLQTELEINIEGNN